MSASLVGSEMCIRDRGAALRTGALPRLNESPTFRRFQALSRPALAFGETCLLYTSDAADDM
eukprot:6743276-Alexandrium_andersonii.AAC.1